MYMFKNPNNPERKPPNEKFFSNMNGIKFENELILEWADEKQCKICLQEIKISPFGNFNGSSNPINDIILYECKLVLTEYRLILIPKIPEISFDLYKEDYFTVPIFNISKVEKLIDKNNLSNFKIEIQTSDFRDLKISLPIEKNCIYETLIDITNPKDSNSFYQFAMKYKSILEINKNKNNKNEINGYEIYNLENEFSRQKINTNPEIKLLEINKDFKLCSSYPEKTYHIITEKITEDDIIKAASYRTKNRYPTLSYYYSKSTGSIWRSSQNKAGIINSRNNYDEKVLESISQLSKINVKNKLIIFDARPYFSAYANKLKGAGFENIENYPNTQIVFCDIDNIHSVRTSFMKLKILCLYSNDNNSNKFFFNNNLEGDLSLNINYFSQFEITGWPYFIYQIINNSIVISKSVKEGRSNLIHCSDGWDRASQLTAFSQLLIEPFYRTIEGFIILIEKEFISFGHQFKYRNGLFCFNETSSDQKSPIFIQFLDCVHQLVFYNPFIFEFNMDFLVFIVYHLTSCKYGTFLCNCEKERKELKIKEKTVSIWTDVYRGIERFKNKLYDEEINNSWKLNFFPFNRIRLWEECYLRYIKKKNKDGDSLNPYQNIFKVLDMKDEYIENLKNENEVLKNILKQRINENPELYLNKDEIKVLNEEKNKILENVKEDK